jgi:hypothetical protein
VSWISLANRKSSADANANANANANTVGASLLAKNLNDDAYILEKRVAFEFFASKLAPTEKAAKTKRPHENPKGLSCGLFSTATLYAFAAGRLSSTFHLPPS